MPRDQSCLLPATVLVAFKAIWNDDFPADSTMPAPYYEVPQPLSSLYSSIVGVNQSTVGFAGRTHTVRDGAVALFDSSHKTTPTNDTALQALAKKIAVDFYSWRCLSNYDRAIAGIVPHAQDGIGDVEWSYHAGDMRTRAIGWPRRDEPGEFQHCDKADPTLPGQWYHALTGGAIGAATSASQMTGGTVTLQKSNIGGALTTLNDAYGNPVTVKAWNKATGGPVPAATAIGIQKDEVGKWIVVWIGC